MARRKKQNEEDQPQENIENPDDTFGLPEIEYEPLKREEPPIAETPEQPASTYTNQSNTSMEREEPQQNDYNQSSYYNEDEESSPWPKILGILAILLVIGGAVWYFGFKLPKDRADEKAKREEAIAAEKRKESEAEAQRLRDAAEQRRLDSLAVATPAAGVIDTLTERTGRYYVIIASSIDGDLIMDYAKKLAPNGLNPKIIPPHGKVKFYRLAIAEGDTYASTQATADELKSQYSGGAWVVKY